MCVQRYASGMYGSSLPLSLPGPSHDTLKRPLDSPQDSATKKARYMTCCSLHFVCVGRKLGSSSVYAGSVQVIVVSLIRM